jgi:nitrate/nitrite-specific signal transduction histidine kinase
MLQLRIENDGVALAETATSGRGLQIMLARARQLDGELQHGCAQQRWWLALQVPIAPSDTPAAD